MPFCRVYLFAIVRAGNWEPNVTLHRVINCNTANDNFFFCHVRKQTHRAREISLTLQPKTYIGFAAGVNAFAVAWYISMVLLTLGSMMLAYDIIYFISNKPAARVVYTSYAA